MIICTVSPVEEDWSVKLCKELVLFVRVAFELNGSDRDTYAPDLKYFLLINNFMKFVNRGTQIELNHLLKIIVDALKDMINEGLIPFVLREVQELVDSNNGTRTSEKRLKEMILLLCMLSSQGT